jgi:hypothetical protein
MAHVRVGAWSCENVRPRETGDAKLNLACCRNCELDSTWFARSAVSDLVAPVAIPMDGLWMVYGWYSRRLQ